MTSAHLDRSALANVVSVGRAWPKPSRLRQSRERDSGTPARPAVGCACPTEEKDLDRPVVRPAAEKGQELRWRSSHSEALSESL